MADNTFRLVGGKLTVRASTSVPDDVAEAVGDEISDIINGGLHAIVGKISEQYRDRVDLDLQFDIDD